MSWHTPWGFSMPVPLAMEIEMGHVTIEIDLTNSRRLEIEAIHVAITPQYLSVLKCLRHIKGMTQTTCTCASFYSAVLLISCRIQFTCICWTCPPIKILFGFGLGQPFQSKQSIF